MTTTTFSPNKILASDEIPGPVIFGLTCVPLILFLTTVTTGTWGILDLIGLTILQCLPFIACLLGRRWDFIAFVCIGHLSTYTFAEWKQVFELAAGEHMRYSAAVEIQEIVKCEFITIATYYAVDLLTSRHQKVERRLPAPDLGKKYVILLGIIAAGYLKYQDYVPLSVARAGSALHLLTVVLLFTSDSSENPRVLAFFKLLTAAGVGYAFLSSGFLTFAITLSMILFIAQAIRRQWINFVLMGPIFAFIVVIQPLKGLYREHTWLTADKLNVLDQLEIMQELSDIIYFGADPMTQRHIDPEIVEGFIKNTHFVLGQKEGYSIEALETMDINQAKFSEIVALGSRRFEDDSLEQVLMKTPDPVPYWGGSTYNNLAYFFIPRLVWPDKPVWYLGLPFGRAYGYLNEEDDTTSIAFSYLAEGYMNFGYVGLYGVAFLLGILIRAAEWCSQRALGRDSSSYSFVYMVLPLLPYTVEAVTLVSSFYIHLTIILICRPFLYKLYRREAY